jgi:hypothetical protein
VQRLGRRWLAVRDGRADGPVNEAANGVEHVR